MRRGRGEQDCATLNKLPANVIADDNLGGNCVDSGFSGVDAPSSSPDGWVGKANGEQTWKL